jgi:hypothetical protein
MNHHPSGSTHRYLNWWSASSSFSAPIPAVADSLAQRLPSFHLSFLLDPELGGDACRFSDPDWNR